MKYMILATILADTLTYDASAEVMEAAEAEIQRHHDLIHRMFITNCMLAIVFLLACIILWITWCHIHTIKEKVYQMGLRFNKTLVSEKNIDYPAGVMSEESEKDESPVEEQPPDDNLFQFKRIERLIMEEKLYLNPNLNRQDILDRLSLNKNHFGRIMQENMQMNFSKYLNHLRIQHAIHLMHKHPYYSTQALAEESGFSNLRNFQRNFKMVTGMTFTKFKGKFIKNNI